MERDKLSIKPNQEALKEKDLEIKENELRDELDLISQKIEMDAERLFSYGKINQKQKQALFDLVSGGFKIEGSSSEEIIKKLEKSLKLLKQKCDKILKEAGVIDIKSKKKAGKKIGEADKKSGDEKKLDSFSVAKAVLAEKYKELRLILSKDKNASKEFYADLRKIEAEAFELFKKENPDWQKKKKEFRDMVCGLAGHSKVQEDKGGNAGKKGETRGSELIKLKDSVKLNAALHEAREKVALETDEKKGKEKIKQVKKDKIIEQNRKEREAEDKRIKEKKIKGEMLDAKDAARLRELEFSEDLKQGREQKIREEELREIELARKGAQITLFLIKDYKELWAETEQGGDEKFKQKTRELWKQFAVHGRMEKDKSGKNSLVNYSDLDGNSSIGLLKLAGIDTKDLKYVEPGGEIEGRIMVDTGGRHGVVLVIRRDGDNEILTVYIDHHALESGLDSSATKFTYELLVSLGLLEKQKYLDEMVEFVTQVDNKNYPEQGKYFKDAYRTVLGLQKYFSFEKLYCFFKERRSPVGILSDEEIKKLGLEIISQRIKNGIEQSLDALKILDEKGFIIPSARYGKIVVDIGRKVPFGFDAARAHGCSTYINWDPFEEKFFINASEKIKEEFSQGLNVRQRMIIKPVNDQRPLQITLGEVLGAMTDGEFYLIPGAADLIKDETERVEKEKMMARGKELLETFNISTLTEVEELVKMRERLLKNKKA